MLEFRQLSLLNLAFTSVLSGNCNSRSSHEEKSVSSLSSGQPTKTTSTEATITTRGFAEVVLKTHGTSNKVSDHHADLLLERPKAKRRQFGETLNNNPNWVRSVRPYRMAKFAHRPTAKRKLFDKLLYEYENELTMESKRSNINIINKEEIISDATVRTPKTKKTSI